MSAHVPPVGWRDDVRTVLTVDAGYHPPLLRCSNAFVVMSAAFGGASRNGATNNKLFSVARVSGEKFEAALAAFHAVRQAERAEDAELEKRGKKAKVPANYRAVLGLFVDATKWREKRRAEEIEQMRKHQSNVSPVPRPLVPTEL